MAEKYRNSFIYNEISIPMDIYRERRNGVRVSLGKKSVILRLPRSLRAAEISKYIAWGESWFAKQAKKNIQLINRFVEKSYLTNDEIYTTRKNYTLQLSYDSRKTLTGRIKPDNCTIELKLPFDHKTKSISALLSRVIAKDQYEKVYNRLVEIDNFYFNRFNGKLKLKFNTSNWGSCSSAGNINISTRLLFAPLDVQDYVLLHELAHLVEANHSSRFWDLVKNAMPDYKNKERWLSENSHLCYF